MDSTFGVNLAAGAEERIFSPNMELRSGEPYMGMEIHLDLKGDKTFDVLSLQEDIWRGQRVEQFVFQVENHGEWVQVASGTTIGYKRLLRFPPVTARRVRLRVLSSRLDPFVTKIGLYKLAE